MDNALRGAPRSTLPRLRCMIDRDPRENNELSIVIIDEHTGRAMYGRQWSDGLHQAVEAKHQKDGVQIKQETQTMATVTLQNYFKLYAKLAGMTGTATDGRKRVLENLQAGSHRHSDQQTASPDRAQRLGVPHRRGEVERGCQRSRGDREEWAADSDRYEGCGQE